MKLEREVLQKRKPENLWIPILLIGFWLFGVGVSTGVIWTKNQNYNRGITFGYSYGLKMGTWCATEHYQFIGSGSERISLNERWCYPVTWPDE